MRYLLIGGTGYVGGRLAKYLKSAGHYVCVTTRKSVSSASARLCADKVFQADCWDTAAAAKILNDTDVVVHLAAPDEIAAIVDPITSINAGGELTWLIMEALLQCRPIPSLVYMSSFHVYGKNAVGEVDESKLPVPIHPYALGKYFGECVVQLFRARHGIKAICIRLSNACGAPVDISVPRWTLVFNDLCRQAVMDRELALKTSGMQQRNFITLEDTARAIEFLSSNEGEWPNDGILNLGSPLQMSILEAAKLVSKRTERLFGYAPAIKLPPLPSSSSDNGFAFVIERLSSMGFTWTNNIEEEIDNTLALCAGQA